MLLFRDCACESDACLRQIRRIHRMHIAFGTWLEILLTIRPVHIEVLVLL